MIIILLFLNVYIPTNIYRIFTRNKYINCIFLTFKTILNIFFLLKHKTQKSSSNKKRTIDKNT